MAHDETARRANGRYNEHAPGGQQQLKKNPLQVKRELPPVPADFAPKQHFLGARAGVCFHAHLREKKEARNPSKLLTRRSAFIHAVSPPTPCRRHGSSGARWQPRRNRLRLQRRLNIGTETEPAHNDEHLLGTLLISGQWDHCFPCAAACGLERR